jgi:BirA family biotin operon repressor/biotin-[acetyl-CoA-carboxylase] ligase
VNHFSPEDLQRIESETFIQAVEAHPQLDSTNNRALQLAPTAAALPLLVLTETQTAGRGRGTNPWWAAPGSLTFSVLLATEAAQLPTERWPQVSLTVGLAVCEALEGLLARGVPVTERSTLPTVQLKWPNDVYLEGRKLAGILVEAPRNCPGRLVLGIGINVNNSVQHAPPYLSAIATTLTEATGRQFALSQVLIEVLQQLAARLQPDTFWTAPIQAGWRKRCFLTGKKIRLDLEVRQVEGVCQGMDDQGALLLEVDGQQQRYFAGVIQLLDAP